MTSKVNFNQKKKNILFVIPEFFYISDYQEGLYYNDLPVGTLQISSYLREFAKITTDILDLRIESESNPQIASRTPDILTLRKEIVKIFEKNNIQDFQNIGINCYTSFQYLYTYTLAQIVKEEFPWLNIIIGGYHSTAIPQDFTFKNSPFDIVVRGEGEIPLLKFFKSNYLNKKLSLRETQIISTDQLVDINTLPFPDYEHYLNKYPRQNQYRFEMYISRGCPYQCAFCATNWEYRQFTYPKFKEHFDNLLGFIEIYNPKFPKLSFADQAFNRVDISDKVLDYILANNLQDRCTFSTQSRVETIGHNLQKIRKIRKCNMSIGYGFESASPKLLTEMHKTQNPLHYIELMKKIINIYQQPGKTYCRINILCGFPGEDKKTFFDSINFIQDFALHENIQVSPTLFANYPNVYAYQNMKYFEEKFGTEFIREWWKLPLNPLKTSVVQKPSWDYSLKDLLWDYKEEYTPLLRVFKKSQFKHIVLWKDFFNKWYTKMVD